MKAERVLYQETLHIDGIEGNFKQFDIGIGWLDPKGHDHFMEHWISVVGQHEDGWYLQAAEASGSLPEIAAAAVDFKDRFFAERIWLDDTALSSASFLQEWDGLTEYKEDGKDRRGKVKYLHKPDHWPHYRNRETLAMLHGVPDLFKSDFQGCIDIVGQLVKDKTLKIRKTCPRSVWVCGASLEEMLSHPLMKALAWPITIMETEKRISVVDTSDVGRYPRLGR